MCSSAYNSRPAPHNSKKTAEEEKTYAAYNAASEDSENNRNMWRNRNTSSTVFSAEPSKGGMSGGKVHIRAPAGHNIFGGGAHADDAKNSAPPKPKASAAPIINGGMERPVSARAMRDAQLRGSGSLW